MKGSFEGAGTSEQKAAEHICQTPPGSATFEVCTCLQLKTPNLDPHPNFSDVQSLSSELIHTWRGCRCSLGLLPRRCRSELEQAQGGIFGVPLQVPELEFHDAVAQKRCISTPLRGNHGATNDPDDQRAGFFFCVPGWRCPGGWWSVSCCV